MSRQVDFGYRVTVLRPGSGRIAVRFGLRSVLVTTALTAAALLVAVLLLGSGDVPISPWNVLRAAFGAGDPADVMVVQQWRGPRVLAALLLGGMLGASGAVFQSLTANPLGSPDVIGFNVGSYTGALVVMLVIGGSYPQVATGALIGGLATALLVYLLAFRRGVQGFRLIIVGIAVSAMLTSVNSWLILKAGQQQAFSASAWGAGSLNDVTWAQLLPIAVAAVVLLPLVPAAARRLSLLELGDDAAAGLGIRVERVRLELIVFGVILTAVATAAAGPIAFVALAAPQLARRLTRSAGVAPAPAVAMGALVLIGSDGIAQLLVDGGTLPVGVVTVSVGGLYLIFLLAREARRQ